MASRDDGSIGMVIRKIKSARKICAECRKEEIKHALLADAGFVSGDRCAKAPAGGEEAVNSF